MREIYVQPGESHLLTEPAVLRTVLGSCVGVAFIAMRHGVGALCHPMLPRLPAKSAGQVGVKESRRYVDFAIRDLAEQLDALGILRGDVQVKLFGGADVLPVSAESTRPTVGELNCAEAERVLADEGFAVAARRLRGTAGLQLRFHTDTGDVLVRALHQTGRREHDPCVDRG